MVKWVFSAVGDGLERVGLEAVGFGVKPVMHNSTRPAVSRRDVNRFMVGAAFWSKKQLKKVKV